jgi:hypothetical protein
VKHAYTLRLIHRALTATPDELGRIYAAYMANYEGWFRDGETARHEAAHAVALLSLKMLPARMSICGHGWAYGFVLSEPTHDVRALGRILLAGLLVERDADVWQPWAYAIRDIWQLVLALRRLRPDRRMPLLHHIIEDAEAFNRHPASILCWHYLSRLLVQHRDLHGERLRAACRVAARAFYPPSEARLIAAWHGSELAGFPARERRLARLALSLPPMRRFALRHLPPAADPPFGITNAPEDPAPGGSRHKKGAAGLDHPPRQASQGPEHVPKRRPWLKYHA